MKKILCLSLAIMLLISVTACSSNKGFSEGVTCEQIMNKALAVGEHPNAEKVYLKANDNLDTYSMSLWADGSFEGCMELDLLNDYAIYMSAGTTTYEISVLKAKEKEDVQKLKELLERRKNTIASGDKGMYDPDFNVRMDNSIIYSEGLYVALFITDDNDSVLKAIEELKK